MNNKKMTLLIDGHGLAFRGFYALPDFLSAPDGTPTNAIVGFTNMLKKCMDDFQTARIALFFDPKGPTRRHEFFKEYKGSRKPVPESFKIQCPLIIEISRAAGVPVFIRDEIEADDYIISTARNIAAKGDPVSIISADKDLLQIIGKNISVIRPTKGVSEFKLYDEKLFLNDFGFAPPLMADYLALLGDAVDNIPGVPGIGEKSAKELVSQFGGLDSIYEHLEELPKGKKAKLADNRELAFISKSLIVPIDTLPVPEDEIVMRDPDMKTLTALCTRLGLKTLLSYFRNKSLKTAEARGETTASHRISTSHGGVLNILAFPEISMTEIAFDVILSEGELSAARDKLAPNVIYLASRSGKTAQFDVNNNDEAAKWNRWCGRGLLYLFDYSEFLYIEKLKLPDINSVRDVKTAHYLLHPDRGAEIEQTLGRPLPNGAYGAFVLFSLWDTFSSEMGKYGLTKLMYKIDMPLAPVLLNLRRTGIYADILALRELDLKLRNAITLIEEDIAAEAGMTVNLSSPMQVGYLLFERLALPAVKKIKTGYSTNVRVLEELSSLPSPMNKVPQMILAYREQSKILTSFVEPFYKLAKDGDGRIHSTFDQLSTGTGRLSSREPNVQNLPVFGEWAVKFRDCFIPSSPDKIFVSADYSQIELRVMAHLSGDRKLAEAFASGRDVHTETASWVFGVPAEHITKEQRRFAKVVNFGLLYGMSAHGLAQRLGITRPQAASIVKRYFDAFPGVKNYLAQSVKEAKDAGYAVSIFGRIRPLNEVSTIEGRGNNPLNRVAVNFPIQSAAADIAKLALIKFDKVLRDEFSSASIILQIHDSIVCECLKSDADKVEKRLCETMESIDFLNVPVTAEAKHGETLSKI